MLCFLASAVLQQATAWNGVATPTSMTERWHYVEQEAGANGGASNGTSFSGIISDGAVLQRGKDTSGRQHRCSGGVSY